MRKSLVLILFVAMAALFVSTAAAQMTTSVKGTIKDDAGKPIAGAEVWYVSVDSGRKVVLKTDKKGEYFSLGFNPGTYDVKLYNNGQLLFTAGGVRVNIAKDNITDIDLSKERSRQAAGMSEADKKRAEEASKESQKVKGLNAKLAEAKTAQDAGNVDQAIAILQEATQIDATKDVLWARLADAYMAGKKYPEAADAFKKAIAIAPTNAAYHNNLGQAYVKDRKTDEAIAEYNQAAQLDPPNAGMYYFNLGAILTNSGKLDDANAAFDKAIAADPNKADAYYWKGVNMLGKATVDKTGKMIAPEGTSEALNKYLELAPEGPYAAATKELLSSIGASVQTSFGPDRKKKK